MKKLLIATAALAMVAGTAQAQSSVTVYGIIDLGVNGVEATGATKESYSTTGQGKGSLSSNRIGFRGTEDLGGGLRANFMLEYEHGPATGNFEQSQRETWVELADNKLGSLRLGRTTGLSHRVIVGNLASGGNNGVGSLAYYSPINGTAAVTGGASGIDASAANRIHGIGTSQVFVNRAITYVSPTMSGLTVSGQFAEDRNNDTTAADADRVSTTGFSASYTVGKLNLAAAQQEIVSKTNSSTEANNKVTTFGGNYNLGMVKAYALYAKNKSSNISNAQTSESDVTSLGLQIPVSAKVNAWVEYGDGETTTSDRATSYDRKGYQVGARYSFSKRTDLYAIYGEQEAKKVSNGDKSELKGYAVGVRHTF
jgi:predicted porin